MPRHFSTNWGELTHDIGMGRPHKFRGECAEARRFLAQAPEIFERLGILIEPDNVRQELGELP